ncbi:MAG TPA: Clp protease N-terminal domain-containing protein [Asanoa sp.]|nr:Clp protease N-terminal domain-containing protein [Asanoa sp.]
MSGGRWVGVGAPVWAALRAAYEVAVRRQGTLVGTIDVLAHAAMRSAPPVFIPAPVRDGLREIATGGNAPLRYSPGETDPASMASLEAEVDAVLREVEWRVRRLTGPLLVVRAGDVERWDQRPRWTPAARAMVGGTLAEARARGVAFAGTSHLFLAMLRLRDCAGARFLAPNDAGHAAALASVGRDRGIDRAATPYPEPDNVAMEMSRGKFRIGARLARFVARAARLDPYLADSTSDIKAQAVRVEHPVAGAGHALLALLRVEACVTATQVRLSAESWARNQGAVLLRGAGLHPDRLAAALSAAPDPSPEVLADQAQRLRLGDPFLADELTLAERQAGDISLGHHHSQTGTTHYLLALLDAPTTAPLLAACNVDAADLRARATESLSAIPSAWS